MLPLSALALLLPLTQDVATRTWNGAELAGMAGRLDGDALVLHRGQRVRLFLPSPIPATGLGAWWSGESAGLSVHLPGSGSDRWWRLREAADLAPEVAGPTGMAGSSRVAALVHPEGTRADAVLLEVRGPCRLESLTLVFLHVPPPPRPAPPVPRAGTWSHYPKPPVWSRASWNAAPPVCTPRYCPTTHVALHHSASASDFTSTSWSQCAANVKAIQTYHMVTRGWCDIGYNYLVCVHGDIFEGRAGGDDVVGAHDGFNCGSMGVCFLGYFHPPPDQVPTLTMWDALAELAAWKCDQQGIDPLGTSFYAGYGGLVANLYGHRDVSATACPGDHAYAGLPALRTEVDRRLGGGSWSTVLDNPQASFAGAWATGTSAPDRYGPDYRWSSTGTSRAAAWWQPRLPAAGFYRVEFWWSAGSNRNPSTRVGVRAGGQTHVVTVDQQQGGGRWNLAGTWWLPATGARIGLVNDGPPGFVVIADALRLVQQ